MLLFTKRIFSTYGLFLLVALKINNEVIREEKVDGEAKSAVLALCTYQIQTTLDAVVLLSAYQCKHENMNWCLGGLALFELEFYRCILSRHVKRTHTYFYMKVFCSLFDI